MKSRLYKHHKSLSISETTIKTLSSEYDVGAVLGSGAYGTVRKVTHKVSGIARAMKALEKRNLEGPDRVKKFFKEIDVMKKLDHPNILKVFEVFEDSANYYIVEELISGTELFEKIVERGAIPEAEAALIMKQIIACLVYCNKNGVMHRDLKPENIMVDNSQGYNLIKIIDWGSAECFKTGEKFKEAVGTPLFMAPEILMKKYDEKCDIWSCGIILYMLLSGTQPFNESTKAKLLQLILKGPKISFEGEVWSKISPGAKKLILKMLTHDAKKRPNAEEILKDPWLKIELPSEKICAGVMDNLRKYRTETKLHQAVSCFLSANITSTEDEKELMEAFRKFDINEDGVLCRDEMYNGLKSHFGKKIADEECDEIMNAIDINKSGAIDYSEFVMGCTNKAKLLSLENLEYAFNELSSEHGGQCIPSDKLKELLFPGSTFKEDVWIELLSQIDLNNDGMISLAEFKSFIVKYSQSVLAKKSP